MSPAARRFRIAFTGDFYAADGTPRFRHLGHGVFAGQDHIEVTRISDHRPQLHPDQLAGTQGVVVLAPKVTAESLAESHDLLAIGRFGVGFDSVDVGACTRADVAAFIAAGAVNHSVAEATVAWLLALTHHVRIKDGLVRAGKWHERTHFMGSELRDRTLGIVGLGGIGRTLVDLLRGFGMNQPLAFDPFLNEETARQCGVRLVVLDELLKTADFVSIHCPLNEQTRNLIGARELALMKPQAYLINTARGGIVDEGVLYDALKQRRIAGAAIDCFVGEPITQPHRLGELDNVLLAPHSIAWTDELFRDIGRTVCQGMLDLSLGKRPNGILNPEVFDRESFQTKWARLRRDP
jgi:phosphoglycerate dehydrogenase-like enzyme